MVKFTHVLVMSILIFWLAGSGCIGNNASKAEEAGIAPNISGAEENTSAEQELTEAEIQEFEENITELENLLENSSLEDEIDIEEL
ncbi:hypothetical protein EO98_18785 [Methanosarcina sp. 2.H.T.1A.6]|uniref:hypothetical protein n=1 Tax=unclassified Methanosarcina TaxID=2644672 RepID=UPI0006212536|nr:MULTISPECIES: hypothetical protein [unclassified Methanosarcina]KKG17007.1 hypothetical protein EO94_18105 [Methanosarcina sp. 2.H.T.1A.3]KKG20369.1 hypothetical protein EO98_18785 [Methanosarcina sp. 2.H.T.1A.6]KKG23366.1 hypothetical protein EO96_17070 [Methanosarcina sp. 2.H.T.1A.8]KKG27742.1 hypothetical protein EO97_00740 [Methanosarcina sp. 2.H.T.1A.15]